MEPDIRKYGILRLVCLVLFLLYTGRAGATHIVGGDLVLIKQPQADLYEIRGTLFFDELNGQAGAINGQFIVGIFSKRSHTLVRSYVLTRKELSYVLAPTLPECAKPELIQTRRFEYSALAFMTARDFGDSRGYYMVWDRCCRNAVIQNIRNPGASSSLFYTEFPAINSADVNSSPVLNFPVADYACIGNPFTLNFGAQDTDGDSLSYEMATPLVGNGIPNNAAPFPLPAPYRNITWVNGYSANNAIIGTPSLNINTYTGRLNMMPAEPGLFLFGIICKEYRRGVQIGMVRRDYQIMVLDCPPGNKPNSTVYVPGSPPNPNLQNINLITITDTLSQCFRVAITNIAPGQDININPIPINFSANSGITVSPRQGSTASRTDTLWVKVCGPSCVNERNFIYRMKLVLSAKNCPQPLVDTAYLFFNIRPPFEPEPVLSSNLTETKSNIQVGESIALNIEGTCADDKVLNLSLSDIDAYIPPVFRELNMQAAPRQVGFNIVYTPTCEDLRYLPDSVLKLTFILRKTNTCALKYIDSLTYRFKLKPEADTNARWKPANIITPNNDGQNDDFTLYNLSEYTCKGRFTKIDIYNRWGAQVFSSDSQDFSFKGDSLEAGTLFYYLYVDNRVFKGFLEIIR